MNKEPKRNVYVGHRYVPLVMGEWDKKETYEGLTIVTYQGASFTSKKRVPVGIDILNEEYWTVTGNYDAQVESYRKDVRDMETRVTNKMDKVTGDMTALETKVTGDMTNLENKVTDDMTALETRVTGEMSDLETQVNTDLVNTNTKIDNVETELTGKIEKVEQSQSYNIKLFGALGDGVNDDTVAFQQVLDICRLNGGGSIFVPSGVYRLTETIDIFKNTDLIMSNGTTLFRDHNSYFILNNERGAEPTRYNGEGNIKISGGVWDCNGKEYPNATCFAFAHGDGIIIENLTIKDVGGGSHAIEFNACSNTIVDNVNFLGLYKTTELQKGEAVQYDISKWKASFAGMGAYDNTPCKNGIVRNCYFGNSDTEGSYPWPRAVGSHGSTIGIRHENIIIENNIFDGMGERTVRLYSYSKSKVINNHFLNCEFGIYLRSPDLDGKASDLLDVNGNASENSHKSFDFVISGNNFIGTRDTVISIAGQDMSGNIENVSVSGNIFRGNRSNCIYCNKSRNINITGNSLFGNTQTNIFVRDSNTVVINNNDIYDARGTAIVCTERVYNVAINGNSINNVDDSGIYLYESVADVTINGNNIKNVGRKADDSYNIKVTSECLRYIITSNVCYGNEMTDGVSCYVTSTNSRGINSNNIYNDGISDEVSTKSGNLV